MWSRLKDKLSAGKRGYVIVRTLLVYGIDEGIPPALLPWWFSIFRGAFFWLRNEHSEKSLGDRLALALQSLGPVFIKFGQMMSTRRDLFPASVADSLATLQDRVTPFSSAAAVNIVLDALQIKTLGDAFSYFDERPLASASIAQVHAATLIENEQDVVVKVLRPDISGVIAEDLRLLGVLAALAQRWLTDGHRLRPVEVVREYEKTIMDELDLSKEAANGVRLRQAFENSEALYVPQIFTHLCHKNLLVMERIYAVPVADVDALNKQGTNMQKLAERGVEVFFTQVFRDSFFHADMHPGNIFVSRSHPDNPQYIAIDFGIVGTLNSEDKRYLAENFIAFFNRDYRKVAQLHADSGWVPQDTNIDAFELSIRSVCDPIFEKPLAEISFGQVLLQLFNTARQFDMVVQPQLVLLQKTLLYVEGLGRQLYPQLDLWKTAKPFLENWMQEQMGFKAFVSQMKRNAPYWSEKLPELPSLLYDTLQRLKTQAEQDKQQHQALIEQMQRQARQLRLTILGATCFMAWWLSIMFSEVSLYTHLLLGAGVIFFWMARRLNKSTFRR